MMTSERGVAPFKEGQTVTIRNNDHLGRHRIDSCEWFTETMAPYWLCECTEIRDPVDWSKYPPGTTGIVTGSHWTGSAEYLELAR